MNEFEDLLNSVSQVEPGDVVSAEVLTVDATQANVAISGTGVEGVLTLRELTNDRDADINDFVQGCRVSACGGWSCSNWCLCRGLRD